MGKIRKALAYSKRKPIVNTRWSKKQQHSYLKSVPPHKIVKFNMGNPKAFENGLFKSRIILSTQEPIQIRDLALEAVRQTLNRELVKQFTTKSFFMRVNVFPHNILRNNRVYSGSSKGERVQTGMTKSFGSPEGRAATIKKGRPIFTIYFNGEQNIAKIKRLVKKVIPKLPCKTKVVFEKVKI